MAETFVVQESQPEPTTYAVVDVPTYYVDNVPMGFTRVVSKLVSRVLTVESRGHLEKPSVNEGNSSEVIAYDDMHYESKKVAIDIRRINEAGMWRVTKTVTITALYNNGVYRSGKTTFDAGDKTISIG